MDYNPPGSPVHGISPAEYWSGMPLTPSWDLPDPGVKPTSLASPALAGMFFTTEPLGKPSRNHDSLSLSLGDFPIGQMVKNLLAMQETLVQGAITLLKSPRQVHYSSAFVFHSFSFH